MGAIRIRDRSKLICTLQGSAKRRSPVLVNLVPAITYHFCLDLPASFMQPGDHLLAEGCLLKIVACWKMMKKDIIFM